jgi:hypothetical protein
VIFLPAGFANEFTAAEQRLVLAHEIAHVARGDMTATLAALAMQAAQWPNPLAHISLTAFRTDQEAACDAFVLARCADVSGAAGNYASAILKSIRVETNSPAFGLALAHPVKERLMLLKSQKKSPVRLIAGAMSVAAFTAVSLAATASYGFAEKAETQTHQKQISKLTVSVDKGETLEISGHQNATKIDIVTENGVRTVKIYGKNNKLLSENVYGPAQSLPFEEVVTVDKNGERRTINLTKPAHPVPPAHPVAGVPPVPGVQRFVMIERDGEGDHDFQMLHCGDGEGHEPAVMEWSSEVSDAEGQADGKVASYEVICMTGDENADPTTRVERLRASIARMEEAAKRDAARREEMIARMREELKEAEKNKK